MDITVTVEQAREPVAIMRLQGSIDASNFVQVVDKAQEIYQNPARNLVIDLSEVPSVSTTGLVAIHKIALLYGGVKEEMAHPDLTHSSTARKHVKLLNPQPAVDKALETAGLKLFFKVFNDLESALNSF
ncbi:MAG TPA: STAS domain-containing protein [Anaerolineales bacterium]|nr:STAS domain-containing protein [Anaerolineales bacterium]HMB22601.1 STAS domain-containing protein [Anaerolineales bacterium]